MPKMKTHRGAAKRFRRRKSGSISRGQCTATHLLTAKSRKRKMHLRRPAGIHETDMGRVRRMLGV